MRRYLRKSGKAQMWKSKPQSNGVQPIPQFSLQNTTGSSTAADPPQKTAASAVSSNVTYDSFDESSEAPSTSTSTKTTTTTTSLSSFRSSLPQTPLLYDFSEIRSATRSFLAGALSSSSPATVWRCSVRGIDAVVIRCNLRCPIDSLRLCKNMSLICRAHHSSLVKLVGASITAEGVYLVYEYVRGSNLADCLRNPRNPSFSVLSSWISRMQIATDVAHGLDYIHNQAVPGSPLIHNRIKSTSIIVTRDSLRAKICGIGAAYLCGEIEIRSSEFIDDDGLTLRRERRSERNRSPVFEGTRGYMSPEFMDSGAGSQKSDVFAFGVVMLELLSGEEPLKYVFDESENFYRRISVIETARDSIGFDTGDSDGSCERGDGRDGGGRVRQWVDRRLGDSFPLSVARRMTRLALECVEQDPDRRPEMVRVAGKISKLYLKSKIWWEKMKASKAAQQTVSFGPR